MTALCSSRRLVKLISCCRMYSSSPSAIAADMRMSSGALAALNMCAHLVAQKSGCLFEETLDYLSKSEPQSVETFVKDLADVGLSCRYSDKYISVVDTKSTEWTRSLHFNTELDLVQSAAPLNPETNEVDFLLPLPISSSNYIMGMSYSFLFHYLNNKSTTDSEGCHSLQRCAVLGAGGCVLPMVTTGLFPSVTVDAVEISKPVRQAALDYFGVAPLVESGRIRLHGGCAIEWMRENEARGNTSFDIIFVDICEMLPEKPSVSEHFVDDEAIGGEPRKPDEVIPVPETGFNESLLSESLDIASPPARQREVCQVLASTESAGENALVMAPGDMIAPSMEVLRVDTLRLLVDRLSPGGVLAINVLANDNGLTCAVTRVEKGLAECGPSGRSFHVGVINLHLLPSYTDGERVGEGADDMSDTEDMDTAAAKRFNSIIYVVKNPGDWFDAMSKAATVAGTCGDMISSAVSMYTYTSTVGTKPKYPFDRDGDCAKAHLKAWMDSYAGRTIVSSSK